MQTPVGKHFTPSLKLINAIKDNEKIRVRDQRKTFYTIFDVLTERLIEGKATGIHQFGTFSVRRYHRLPGRKLGRKPDRDWQEIPTYMPVLIAKREMKIAVTFAINNPAQQQNIIQALREKAFRMLLPIWIMDEIFERTGVHPSYVVRTTRLLFEAIIISACQDKIFVVPGFGTFGLCRRPSYPIGVPKPGETPKRSKRLIIPRFLPEKQLTEAVTESMRLKDGWTKIES